MTLLALVLAASSGDLVLKEKARVQGRWVRLADLVREGSAPADVWLGRAPEDGATRVIEADEIRRELELRGHRLSVSGGRVLVERGPETGAEALRRDVAFGIKRAVMERDALRADEIVVRLKSLSPEPGAAGGVADVRPEGDAFLVVFADGSSARAAADVVRLREAAFALREIPAGKVIEAGDVEFRRTEAEGAAEPVGATAAARIAAGTMLGEAALRRKAVVRRGELVRFVSEAYEIDARALDDGAVGREIDVEIPASKARARGRVAGAGRVEAKR